MADAGYREVRLHVLDAAVEVGSLAGSWETVSLGMGFLAMLLPRLPVKQATAVRDAVHRSGSRPLRAPRHPTPRRSRRRHRLKAPAAQGP